MSYQNENITWHEIWIRFKELTGSENTYEFYKWVFENGFKPKK